MGFGIKKAIATFSSKDEQLADKVVGAITRVSNKQAPIPSATKSDRNINTNQPRRSKSGDRKAAKTVSFDLNCNRSVKIVPTTPDASRKPPLPSKPNSTTSTRKPHLTRRSTTRYPTSSDKDASRRSKALVTNGSIDSTCLTDATQSKVSEHPSKSTVALSKSKSLNTSNGTSSSISAAVSSSAEETEKPHIGIKLAVAPSTLKKNDSPSQYLKRVPSSGWLHSRNLSYGTIYSGSKAPNNKSTILVEEEQRASSKFDQAIVTVNTEKVKGQANSKRVSSKFSQSKRHVFGLGGCNYGHGSIINSVKSIESLASNPDSICNGKKSTEVKNTGYLSTDETVEQLKASGNEEYKRKRFAKAISFYDKALVLCPDNVGCINNRAATLVALGNISEGVEEYLKVTSHDPTYTRAHYQLGVLYTRLGQVAEARKHLNLWGHDKDPQALNHLQVVEEHMKKIEKYIKLDDWSLVLTQCTQALEAGADASYLVVAARAEALLKLRRSNEALDTLLAVKSTKDWSQGRKTQTGSSRLLFIAIQVYFYFGRFEEAVEAAEEAISIDLSKESLMWLKKAWGAADAHRAGDEYYKLGKYSKASAMYSQGLKHDHENGILLSKRAACKGKLGHWEKAIRDSNTALERCHGLQEALLQRALAHARLRTWRKAQRDYSELIKLMPGDPTVLNSLFEMHMEIEREKSHQTG